MVVWLFAVSWWGVTAFLARESSNSQIPSALTPSLLLGLIFDIALQYGPILLFLFIFVRWYEHRQGLGLRSLLSSLGWNRNGVRKSLIWSLIFLLAAIPIGLVMLAIESAVAGSGAEHLAGQTTSSSIPAWYFSIAMVSLLADVLTEETTVRGYILDRLIPAHPCSLRGSLNAVVVTSVMMSSYHLLPYIYTYGFSLPLTAANLVADFLFSVLISFAYVKSRARNLAGPILFHFILDAGLLL